MSKKALIMSSLKIFSFCRITFNIEKSEELPKKFWFRVNNGSTSFLELFSRKKLKKILKEMDDIQTKDLNSWCIESMPIKGKDTNIEIIVGRATDKDYVKKFPEQEYWITLCDLVDTCTINMYKEDFLKIRDLIETVLNEV